MTELWKGKGAGWGTTPDPAQLTRAMPKSLHFSASQISRWRDCQRKWALRYIGKHPDKANAFAILGKYIHKRLEEYLLTGELRRGPEIAIEIKKKNGTVRPFSHDDIVKIMLPGIVHLPDPGVARCEKRFSIPLGDLGEMIGFIDFAYAEDGIPIVGDHKTTSNMGYALTGGTILEDPQAVIYAKCAMVQHNTDEAGCRWVYYSTGKPKAKLVEARFSLTQIAPLWDSVLMDVRAMVAVYGSGCSPKEVPYDIAACKKYGGCPYESICQLSAGDRWRGYSAMATLRERMKLDAAPAAALPSESAPLESAPSAQAPASAPPATGMNPPEGVSAIERLKAKKQAASAAAQAPAAQAPAAQAPAAASAAVQGAFVLYIDCAPAGGYQEFTEIAQPVLDEIKREFGHHYKQIPDMFGGNAAVFSEALAKDMDADPPVGAIVVTMASPMVRDVIEVLMSRAALIVRGF